MDTNRNSSVGRATFTIALALLIPACGGKTVRTTAADPTRVDVAQLWVEPADLETRDLFAGPPGGSPPDTTAAFTFVEADTSGFSPGYDVRDAGGTTWSVKLGSEAQTEIVSSHLLWAIGYHQLPTYYVQSWSMAGGPEASPGPGRFRPELTDRKAVDEWSWYENEFVDTQAFKGLIVANLMLNNWDWKASNNKVYEMTAGAGARRQYVVRDLGASLGKTSSPPPLRWFGSRIAQGNRNNLEDFEGQGFIKRVVVGDHVEFDYSGIYGKIVETVTVRDVVWTSRLLSRLSDAQWNDAFRAGGYSPEQSARYIAKLKSKVAEGLALRASTEE